MKFLALEASTATCSVALQVGNTIEQKSISDVREQTRHILPMVDELLGEAGLALSQLDAIIVGQGPGAFTGLRVAIGVAQGLGFAVDLPVVPVSSLAALAQGVHRVYEYPRVLAALDARMGEVYWGVMHLEQGLMTAMLPERVCSPDDVAFSTDRMWFAAGSGWTSYAERLMKNCGSAIEQQDVSVRPEARDALKIGARAFTSGDFLTADQAQPVYLRNKVASKRK